MNKKQTYITDEEKEKCQKVVDAFAELFENEDLAVVNAGKYGFIKLQYYRNHVGVDNAFSFNDSRHLFNDLWDEWLDTQLLNIAGDTPMAEMDYGDILKCLPPEKQQELLDMRKRLAEKAGVGDMPDKPAQAEHLTADKRGENKLSVLERLYMGNLCPVEEAVPHDTEYRALSNKIGEEREYFEGILSAEDRERFEKWNTMVFRYEDITEYANFAQGFRLGAMLTSEIFIGSESE